MLDHFSAFVLAPLKLFERTDISANMCLFKINNRNIRKWFEVCSKLTINIPEQHEGRRSSVFVVNFEHISHLFLVFLLLTLKK